MYWVLYKAITLADVALVSIGAFVGSKIHKITDKQPAVVEPDAQALLDEQLKQMKQYQDQLQDQFQSFMDLERANQLAIEAQRNDFYIGLIAAMIVVALGFGLMFYFLKKK